MVAVKSTLNFNLIGEHTDYNGGFVLPGCVDRHIWFAFKKMDPAENQYKVSAKSVNLSYGWVNVDTPSKDGNLTHKHMGVNFFE